MVDTTLISLNFASIKIREKTWAILCEYLISQILGIYRDFQWIFRFCDFSQIMKFTKFNTCKIKWE